MVNISVNEQDKPVEDCALKGSFFTMGQAGRYVREHPDDFDGNDIAWYRAENGRTVFATIAEVKHWGE